MKRLHHPMHSFAVVLFAALSLAPTRPTETVYIEMADGTKLAADCYLPKDGGPTWPVVLARSAYARAIAAPKAERFTNRGYAAVMQDLRGMGHSQGEKNIFHTDGWRPGLQDGADTVAWVRAQPWCNGKVATFGPSALGITQVLMAPSTKDVACQCIRQAPSNFYYNLAYQGGVWRKNLCDAWLTFLGLAHMIPVYKSHPSYDEFWTFYNAEAKAPEITAPGLHSGGWFDIFQQGTINNFVTRQNNGGPGAKGNQKLVMDWTAHAGGYSSMKLRDNRREVSVSRMEQAFLAHWLKDDPNGIMDEPAVHYYVMGDDSDPGAPGMEWRTADTWPPFETNETPYFLHPNMLVSPEAAGDAGTVSFTFDPADPLPTHGGAHLFLPAGPLDQREVNRGRQDLLEFATHPLTEPVEATGRLAVRLYVSTDAPDTDFTAKLVDIYPEPDGRQLLVLDGIQRVKYRDGGEKPAPLLTSTDEVVEVNIDLWSTSWVFNTGHRIGVQISSSNYPRFEINPNSGDDFPSKDNLRAARNTVHMGEAHPSAFVLPIRPRGE